MAEQFEIAEDGCFTYAGNMSHDRAVVYFNSLMESGVWLDPDCALEKRTDWDLQTKCEMRNRMRLAFDRNDKFYGELAFGILCYDRSTGQFGIEPDFRGVVDE